MTTSVVIHIQATKPRNAADLKKPERETSASGEKGEVMVFSKKIQLQQTILKSSRIHFKWGFTSIRKRLKCGRSSLFWSLNTDFFPSWISQWTFLLRMCHCYSVLPYEANWLQMLVFPHGSLSPCTIWSSNSFLKSLLVPWFAHQIPELVQPAQRKWQTPGADCWWAGDHLPTPECWSKPDPGLRGVKDKEESHGAEGQSEQNKNSARGTGLQT